MGAPLAEHGAKFLGWRQLWMGVPAQPADGRLRGRILAEPDAPQATAIGHRQLAAALEGEMQLGEARGPLGGGVASPVGDEAHTAPAGA
mgnify:CR=1 FL=1